MVIVHMVDVLPSQVALTHIQPIMQDVYKGIWLLFFLTMIWAAWETFAMSAYTLMWGDTRLIEIRSPNWLVMIGQLI